MRKFFEILFKFLFPLILFAYPLDIFISKNLLKSNTSPGNYKTWNDIYNGTVNSELLIYGSSRASMHIDPTILEDSLNYKAYNFGILGHNFSTQYLRHLEYLKYNPPPKHIILCIDLFSLEKRVDLYESNQFLPYMLWNHNMRNYTNSYKVFSLQDYYVPLIRYLGKTSAIRKALESVFTYKKNGAFKYKGYRSTNSRWNNDMFKESVKRGGTEINIDSTSLSLFDKFLIECAEKNVQVTLVYTPEFIDGQKFVVNRKEIFSMYQNYAIKYNLTLLNYANDSICSKKKYFYNSLHLNKTGAEFFSKKLGHDLKGLSHFN